MAKVKKIKAGKSKKRILCKRCETSKVWLHPLDTCPRTCWTNYYGLRDHT